MKKHRYLIANIVLIIAICISSYFLFKKDEELAVKQFVITGTITNIRDNTVVIKDNSGLYYDVSVDTNIYEIGDVVAVYPKSGILETNPARVPKARLEILERSPETLPEKPIDSNNGNIDKKNPTTKTPSNSGSSSSTKETNNTTPSQTKPSVEAKAKSEDEAVKVFSDLNNDLDSSDNSETFKSKLKKNFVTCMDFIFYGGTIEGYTFKDLSNSAKLKVLKIALSIDSKIDSKLPGYKQSIASTTGRIYNSAKIKIVEMYLDITTKLCNSKSTLCEDAKKGFTDMKKSFGLTWDFIKTLSKSGIDKLNDWYTIWKTT